MKDAGSSKWDVINYEGRRAPPDAFLPTAASNGGAEAASVGGWAAVTSPGGAQQSPNLQTSFDAPWFPTQRAGAEVYTWPNSCELFILLWLLPCP